MAHNVETMIYTQAQPWHGLGIYLGDNVGVTTKAAMEADKRIGSNVNAKPLIASLGDGLFTKVEGSYAMVREVDNRVVGVVGEQFAKSELQPSRMFEFFDVILGANQARIHTAGLLDEGRRIWILAKLSGADIRIKGTNDLIEKYLLLCTAFDGTMNLSAFFTPTRVVCQNTLIAALQGERYNGVKIRHTKNAINKLEEAERTMKASINFYNEFDNKVQLMANTKITDKQREATLRRLFDLEENQKLDLVSTRTLNMMDKVRDLTVTGMGNKPWEGTAWGLYNACTEFADHHMIVRGARDSQGSKSDSGAKDKILSSVWFGAASDFKSRAIKAIDSIVYA